MNCDKEYRYEVRDIVIVKVDTETGEEVLNRDGSIKHFRPIGHGAYLRIRLILMITKWRW
jgi:hypothetical protein